MKKIFKLSSALCLALLSPTMIMAAPNPVSQDWVKNWVTTFVTANFAPISTGSTAINWSSLCSGSQTLESANGCTPDCTTSPAAATCTQIFAAGQVPQLTGVPLPYLSNGVVVFKLTEVINAGNNFGTGASLFLFLNANLAASTGYNCEILNSNGTPATVYQTSTPYSTSIITMDDGLTGPNWKSANYVNVNSSSGGYLWFQNASNPLYMMCLGYQVPANSNYIKSYPACGGTGTNPACVSYTWS